MNIQLQANTMVEGDVTPVTMSEATFFSLYQGEPGNYEWVADFDTYILARSVGWTMANYYQCDYVENIPGERA